MSADTRADNVGRCMFRERLAAVLLPFGACELEVEIKHISAEARAAELLRQRLANGESQ